MIDLHCHILPGLDDGPQSVDAAVEMLRIAIADGIDTIVATPHQLNGIYKVRCAEIYQGVEALQNEACKNNLPVTLLPGADVHVDKDLPQLIGKDEIVTLAGKRKHLMVELPKDVFRPEIADLLFHIQLMGLTPIITHPERNIEVQKNPAPLRELIEAGILIQVTAGSLTGAFGPRIQDCSLGLLRKMMIHLVATDAHSPDRRPPRLSEARALVEEQAGNDEARRIFEERPARLIQGFYVEPPEPPQEQRRTRKTLWHRLSALR